MPCNFIHLCNFVNQFSQIISTASDRLCQELISYPRTGKKISGIKSEAELCFRKGVYRWKHLGCLLLKSTQPIGRRLNEFLQPVAAAGTGFGHQMARVQVTFRLDEVFFFPYPTEECNTWILCLIWLVSQSIKIVLNLKGIAVRCHFVSRASLSMIDTRQLISLLAKCRVQTELRHQQNTSCMCTQTEWFKIKLNFLF